MRDYAWVTDVLVDLAKYCTENELTRTAEQVRFAEDALTEELYLSDDCSIASLPEFRSTRRYKRTTRPDHSPNAADRRDREPDAPCPADVVPMPWRSCRSKAALR